MDMREPRTKDHLAKWGCPFPAQHRVGVLLPWVPPTMGVTYTFVPFRRGTGEPTSRQLFAIP
eukprot:scaffold1252_cov154-Amphora_coffeaeformis.AAC.4